MKPFWFNKVVQRNKKVYVQCDAPTGTGLELTVFRYFKLNGLYRTYLNPRIGAGRNGL